jgi:hypothetical protein
MKATQNNPLHILQQQLFFFLKKLFGDRGAESYFTLQINCP